MKKKVVFVLSFLSSFFLSAQASTQEPDSIAKVYTLGEIGVYGSTVDTTQNKLLTGSVNAQQMQTGNRHNLTDALNLISGIAISEAGARNEGTIYLRGFKLLQTPVFYDGVPIYAPYDGNVDLNRFTTFDLSQITVSKALTSVLYGPNTMGGAINLISRKPAKLLEVNGISGLKYSRNGLNGTTTSVNVGSAHEQFYVLGSASYVMNNFTSLSDKFVPGKNEDGGRRFQSDSRDFKISAKVGYTPKSTDEYSLNFIIQDARKGIPPATVGNQYRRYPKYNKNSIYYRSKTDLGSSFLLNFNIFYDSYYNIMSQFDDSTYTLQNSKKAFNSIYDDYTLGSSANLSTKYFKNNELKLALYEKYDCHREHNATIAANEETGQKEVSGEPVQKYLDNTFSVGLEDIYTFNPYLDAIGGISYNQRKNIKAQEYGTQYLTGESNVLYDFPKGSDHTFNYQLAAVFKPASGQKVVLSASRKSRFASQKERYSSKFGSQIPNPDLGTEYSWVFDITYSGQVSKVLQYEVSIFRNNLRNAIYEVTQGIQEDGTAIYQNQNVGKAVFQGYELAFAVLPVRYITLGANYSYIHRKNEYDETLKYVDVPDHKLIAYSDFRLPYWDAKLHFDIEINSKRYVTSDGETLPGFMLMNANLTSKVWKGFSLETGIRNLFDKNYYLTINYPREGRTFYSSLIYNF